MIDIASVACGWAQILALTTGGDVLSWGRNTMGALGRGSTAASIQTAGFLSGGPPSTGTAAVYASPINDYSYALGDDGRYWAWGTNTNGQLGLSPTLFPRANAPIAVGMILP